VAKWTKKIVKLISQNNIPEAISAKEAILKELSEIAHLDPDKHVTKLIQMGENALEDLKKKRDLALTTKTFHNLGYLEDEDDAACYASGSDSDSGNYSDNDAGADSQTPPHSHSNDSDSGDES